MPLNKDSAPVPASQIHYADAESGERLPIIPQPSLLLSSAEAHWNGIIVEHFRLPPMEPPESVVPHHLLTLKLSPPSALEWKSGGHFRSRSLLPGDVCLVPSGVTRQLRWHEEVEVLALALDPLFIADVANDTSRVELIESHGSSDLQVQHIGLALKAELASGCPGGRLYGDSLATALAVHLVQHYNAFPRRLHDGLGALSRSKLRRVIDYINDNLDNDLALPEIAAVVQISPYHFARQFKQAMGTPPHEYVLQRRIAKSQLLLREGRLSVGEIAHQLGFSDQSHFTRRFKQQIGVTPRAYQHDLTQ